MKRVFLVIYVILFSIFISIDSVNAQSYNINTVNGTTITGCSFTIYDSGGSGGNYSANEDYSVTICSGSSNNVRLTFVSFNTESNYDMLYVYDGPNTGSPEVAGSPFSGSTLPSAITSTGSCITIRFSSDVSIQNSGFQINTSCVALPSYNMTNGLTVNTCNALFYDSGGPSGNYGNNENITMTFCSGTTDALRITFTAFQTSNSSDYLEIYNGPNTASPLIGSYHTSNNPGTITSTGTCLTFRFISNNNGNTTGWAASITCVPPPPPNDLCANATSLPCGTNNLAGTTNFTTNVAHGTGCTMSNYGVWYTFTGDGQQTTISSTAASGYDHEMAIASGTCGSLTNIACRDAFSGGTETHTFITTPGVNYYVYIAHYGDGNTTTGNFTISRTCTPVTVPSNDNCINATALTVNPDLNCGVTTHGDLSFATASGNPVTPCSGTANDDVWYSFVATSSSHRIELLNVTGSTTDLYHAVYSGNCGSLTNILCSDPNSSTVTGLTPGNTYYVRVYSYGSTQTTTSFDICIGTPPPPPPNDECVNAIPLTVNSDYNCADFVSGTITSATPSAQAISPCSGTPNDDVWYSFVATSSSHRIELLNVTGSTTDLYHAVYSGNCGSLTNILCSDPNSSTVTGLTPGNTYYVRVYTWSSTVGANVNFDICIGTPPPPGPGDLCNTAIAFCTGTNYNFPTGVDNGSAPAGPNYGCLCTQPNPIWYYLQIQDSGPLSIEISSNCGDVDYAAWGPFSNFTCNPADLTSTGDFCTTTPYDSPYGNMVDCSYSTASTEYLDIPNAQNGEFYIVMINNFANCTGTISFSQIGGSGTTNCAIVAPPVTNNGPICEGDELHLIVTYPVAGATYSWTGPNGFTSNQMNPIIPNATSANAGTYTLVITVGGISSPPETTIVVVNPWITPNFTQLGPYCVGDTPDILPTTSNNGITGTWSPSTINTSTPGTTTYTFTPDAGQCAYPVTMDITITNLSATPIFTALGPYCVGDTPGTLPTTSNNGISGTWSPATINTAVAGTTTYTFTPNAGQCANTTTMNVTVNQVTAIATAGSILCNGGTTTVTVSASGGTAPYTGTGTFTVSAGTHNYTVTDANGCTDNTSITVTQPSALTASATAGSILCNGGTTTVTVSASGGTAPYSGTGTFTVSAGTHNYTVTDANGCTANTSVNVSEPTALTASATAGSILCNGGTTTVTVSASGGTAPYTGTGTFTVSAGTHNYTVTDANGCTANTSVTVTQPTALTASATAGSILCNGGTTTVTVSASGGTAPYTGTGTFTVPAGTHNYTVTDANGCSANTSVNVTEPTVLSSSILSLVHQNCLTPGSASVTGVDGTPPYNYSWPAGAGGVSGGDANILTAGTYIVTITDANACNTTVNVVINDIGGLTANASVLSNVLCNGGNQGAIDINIISGTSPFIINWASGSTTESSTNYTINGLIAGNYSITITDVNSCQTVVNANISEPTVLTATAIAGSILCNGGTTTVTVSASGGTAPYTGTGTFTVPAGTHNYTVTDANGCSANTSVNVSEPTALNISLNITNASCHGETNGSIIANANGGTFPYLYSWSNGQYGQMINNLAAGTYTVTVSDLNNCTAVASGNVNQPDQIYVFLSSQPAQCGGNGGGSIASIIGGTSPFNYIWSNGVSENNISNVSPGSYSITVIDSNNCTASQNVTINTVGSLNVSISVLNPISCQGYSDGSLTANVANGVEPYSYNWSNGINTSINNNLSTGTYFVVVTDQWGCNGSSSIILTEPTGITVNANINNVTCYGYSNGTISVLVSGGSGNYSYLWNTGSISSNISELNSGSYQLTIVDGGVCTSTYSFEVTQPEELILSADVHNISCFGNVDGGIILTATGGTSPYNYSIYGNNNILNGNQFNNLVAGYYTCYVEDVNLCSDTVEVIISEPASLTANFSYSNPSCIGNNNGEIIVNVTGGTEPYLFSWQNGSLDFNVITGLTEGIYNITITDNNNCQLYLPSITLTDAAIDCLVIPNAFTPNGDGINDTWIIENLNLFPSAYVYVYNRWGQELWVGRPGNEWDGTFEGKLMPAGTYLYIIELFDGTTPYKGTVTIIY